MRPAATAPQPARLCPREMAQTPAATAHNQIRTGHQGARVLTGGIESQKANTPSAMPPIAIHRGVRSGRARLSVGAVVMLPPPLPRKPHLDRGRPFVSPARDRGSG